MMQRYSCWIERHNPARAEQRALRMNFFKIVEPEARVVFARITFHKRKLGPSHGIVEASPAILKEVYVFIWIHCVAKSATTHCNSTSRSSSVDNKMSSVHVLKKVWKD
jgi:hypothetical protein